MKGEFDNLSIFLDESGATGGNFLDALQPFFIQAGIIVQDDNISKVEEVFNEWEKKRLKPRQKEIKGNKLLKSRQGFVAFEELYRQICPHILCSTFSILDKKYGLCITMVEAFLDSYYNPLVGEKEFFWEGNRPDWAEVFCNNLSLKTLQLANDTVLNGSYASFVDAHSGVVNDLKEAGEDELSQKVQSCPLESAFQFLAQTDKQISSNGMGFRTHIFSIKNELIKNPPKTCRIFHDEQPHYEKIFNEFIEMSTNGPTQFAPVSKDKTIIWGAIGEWSLGFEKSHNSPLIKIADLICSYLKSTLESLHREDNIGYSSQELYNLLWTPLFRHVFPDKFKDLPEWYYEGIPLDMQIKLVKHLKAKK